MQRTWDRHGVYWEARVFALSMLRSQFFRSFVLFSIALAVFGFSRAIQTSQVVTVSERLSGRILIEVEENGEAWYVNPDDLTRSYLGRPDDAFAIMRQFGVGISNIDFNRWNGTAPKRWRGRIILNVEDDGKAYYSDPSDGSIYFLGRPDDAFAVMRSLGLGINTADLEKIPVSSDMR